MLKGYLKKKEQIKTNKKNQRLLCKILSKKKKKPKQKTKQKNNGKTKVEKDKKLAMRGRKVILSSTLFLLFSPFWRD